MNISLVEVSITLILKVSRKRTPSVDFYLDPMLKEVPHVWVLTEGFPASSTLCHLLFAVILPCKINLADKDTFLEQKKHESWNFQQCWNLFGQVGQGVWVVGMVVGLVILISIKCYCSILPITRLNCPLEEVHTEKQLMIHCYS